MTDVDSLERPCDLLLQIAALKQDAARSARTHRARVRLFNETFAQSRAYWLAVRQAQQ